MLELLSPAGSVEALHAAVQNGADAVYMGYGDYNARRNAKNFTEEEFAAAVSYCHLRGTKVYLTLNTLLTDRELPGAARTVALANDIGVDAILVQDLGVMRMVRQVAPDFPIHASTQMTVHNLDGVKQMADFGMTRVVLSRELSRDAIAHICAHSPVEIEVFGHGALCMCYSGQCFFSSVIGGRSGNRGLCAQPCRMKYGWNGRADSSPLSLKDMSLAGHLKELEDMGVACLKLEGRMKRPEYVAIITRVYADALREHREPTPEEVEALTRAFSRQGFTDGYFLDKKGPHMFGVREEEKEPRELFAKARQTYTEGENQRIPVEFTTRIRSGEPVQVELRDPEYTVTVEGPVPEAARTRDLTPEYVEKQLSRTGGTPFRCEGVHTEVEPGLSLSASALNALRRDSVEALTALRTAKPERRVGQFKADLGHEKWREAPQLTVSVRHAAQVTPELVSLHPALIYVPLEELFAHRELAGTPGLAAILPRVAWDREWGAMRTALRAVRDMGVEDVLVGNLGMLKIAREEGFRIRGDYGLEVYNSQTLKEMKDLGLTSATMSFELKLAQIRDISKPIPTEVITYGRLPLMIMENCIVSNRTGGKCHGACQEEKAQLTDRKGAKFPVVQASGCRNEILNSRVLFLADRQHDVERSGVWAQRLMFTLERPEECVKVARRYLGLGDWEPGEYTRGLYYRDVE